LLNPGFLSVQSITPASYTQNSVGAATVTVRNTGDVRRTRLVYFKAPLDSQQAQSLTLEPGASATLRFNFRVPSPGSFTLTATADDTRNQLCTAAGTPYTPPPDSAGGDRITWTEEDGHDVTYDIFDDNGNRTTARYRCVHHFTYRAIVTPSLTLSPSTLKSGYGFAVDAGGSLSTSLTQQGGGCDNWRPNRSNSIIASTPDQAQIRVGWTVTMRMKNNTIKTQARNINLDRVSRTAALVTYQAPQSPVSETGERRIYTDVALAGTKTSPRNHNVTLWLGGGGIPSRNLWFDMTLTRQITINGVMYEDDATGHN
jgi:hypothetical protein